MTEKFVEFVKFKMIVCPRCNHQFCWVNPRLPMYCPECGNQILSLLRIRPENILVNDEAAELHVHRQT